MVLFIDRPPLSPWAVAEWHRAVRHFRSPAWRPTAAGNRVRNVPPATREPAEPLTAVQDYRVRDLGRSRVVDRSLRTDCRAALSSVRYRAADGHPKRGAGEGNVGLMWRDRWSGCSLEV